ncbi:MAG TPA: hypothetical protein VHT53_05090 [Candidatus Elarobacter sp.]|nr:hypothetical protein [Candidatus Elarobacter sp.]
MTANGFGRHVFGAAAVLAAACGLALHDVTVWETTQPLAGTAYRDLPVYGAAVLELCGGLAIQWRRTARAGALALAAVYAAFVLLSVPVIVRHPLVYNAWGDFFELLSLVCGATIVYASFAPADAAWARTAKRIAYGGFAVCVVSFAVEQLVYLDVTASFVPAWVPPGRMFWAVVTTIAFALAAVALLAGWRSALASTLLTLMLVLFGFLVWLPLLFANPRSQVVLAGNTENLAVAGAAWIVADLLARRHPSETG